MTEKLLNRSEVASSLQEMGRERVPEGVRARLRANRGSDQAPGHDPPHGAIRKVLSSQAREKRISAQDLTAI